MFDSRWVNVEKKAKLNFETLKKVWEHFSEKRIKKSVNVGYIPKLKEIIFSKKNHSDKVGVKI